MATVAQPENEEEQNQQTPTASTAGAPIQVAGTGGAPASTAGGPAASGQGAAGAAAPANVSAVNQNQNQTPGYADVSSYLNANQTGATNLGQQASNYLTGQYNTTMGDINNSAANQTGLISSGYTPESTQLIQQVAANPTQAASNPNTVSQFQGQLNDTYTGPTNWNDITNAAGTTTVPGYGTLQGEVNSAQQIGSLYNTPGGTNVLAQNIEGNNTSGGINQLDALLMGSNPQSADMIAQASQPFTNLNTYLNTQNTNLGNQVTAAQTAAAQAPADALAAFTGPTGTLTNLNNSIQNSTAADLAATGAQQTQLAQDISNLYNQPLQAAPSTIGTYGGTTPWGNTTNYTVGNLSPQDLASLGITQDQWTALQQAMQGAGTSQMEAAQNFGVPSATTQINLNSYLNQVNPDTLVNAGTVATPQQYQEMSAINQLLGTQAPVQSEAINPALASVASGYTPQTGNTFNYQGALQAAQAAQQSQIQQAQAEDAAIVANANAQHAASDNTGFGGFLKSIGLSSPYELLIPPLALGQVTLNEAKKV